MSSSTRRRRPPNQEYPPHLRERSRQLGVRPAPSISLHAPTSRAKSRKAFNSLATQKILDYEKRKQELIEFTEKVSKRKIKEGLKRYKMTNKETMFDFLTRLDRYPGIEAVIPIDGIRSGYYTGLRLLIDGDFPKTSLPNNAPVENTRKRIIVDILYDNLFQIIDIYAPTAPYMGSIVDYYSTVDGVDTGLENIALVELGVKDTVLLNILKTLERIPGENYCKSNAFKSICRTLETQIRQSNAELRPSVDFTEATLSPDGENINPAVRGIISNKINMYEFLPILMSNFLEFLKNQPERERSRFPSANLIKKLENEFLKKNTGDPGTYGKTYMFRDPVTLDKIATFFNQIVQNISTTTTTTILFERFMGPLRNDYNEKIKDYLKPRLKRLEVLYDLNNPGRLLHIVKELLERLLPLISKKNSDDVSLGELRFNDLVKNPKYKNALLAPYDIELSPAVAEPIQIQPTDVEFAPPRDLTTIPSSETVVDAIVTEPDAGLKKSKKNIYKPKKTNKQTKKK